MARILITMEPGRARGGRVMLDERIIPSDLDSDHFAAALIERIGWALVDADDAERRRRIKQKGHAMQGQPSIVERKIGLWVLQ